MFSCDGYKKKTCTKDYILGDSNLDIKHDVIDTSEPQISNSYNIRTWF
jgi:hypothetical protein